MVILAWGTFMETGHEELDQQHRALVDLIGDLHTTPLEDKGRAGELLVRLKVSAEAHFQWEEELMRQHRFPKAAEHVAAHQIKLRELHELTDHFHKGEIHSVSDWLERWQYWFVSQMLYEDQALVDYLRG